jgi:hypothetical protein
MIEVEVPPKGGKGPMDDEDDENPNSISHVVIR